MHKNMAPKLSSLLCLKHFPSYLVQISVHIFALYAEGGGHSRISDVAYNWKRAFCLQLCLEACVLTIGAFLLTAGAF